MRLKFGIEIDPDELAGQERGRARGRHSQARCATLYRQKEIEFPVQAAMARFMAEKAPVGRGGQRYDREGLYRWAHDALPDGGRDAVNEDDFRTEPRAGCRRSCSTLSRQAYPANDAGGHRRQARRRVRAAPNTSEADGRPGAGRVVQAPNWASKCPRPS